MTIADGVLHTKYRPRKFKDVVGQDSAVKMLEGVIKRDGSHAFLFHGPSGCGKTTLARICAQELGAVKSDIVDIDASRFTGVDDMRAVLETSYFSPLGGDSRAIIVDEAHGLSKQAWNSLLKAIEEPANHTYWFFCTTEPGKVIQTVKTRCTNVALTSVPEKILGRLYDRVCDAENIDLPGDVGDMVIRQANGSPRQLLVNIEQCRDAVDKKDAARRLEKALEGDASLEFCRFITKGGSWLKAMEHVQALADQNPEGVRIIVVNYVSVALSKATTDKQAQHFLGILDAFSTPYNASEKQAPLILSIGRVLFGQ